MSEKKLENKDLSHLTSQFIDVNGAQTTSRICSESFYASTELLLAFDLQDGCQSSATFSGNKIRRA